MNGIVKSVIGSVVGCMIFTYLYENAWWEYRFNNGSHQHERVLCIRMGNRKYKK